MEICSCIRPNIERHKSGTPVCRSCGRWHMPAKGGPNPDTIARELMQLQPQIHALASRPFTWLGFKFNTPAPAAR